MAESFSEYLKRTARNMQKSVDAHREKHIDPFVDASREYASQLGQDTRDNFERISGHNTEDAQRLQQAATESAPVMREAIMDHGGQFVKDNPIMAPLIGGSIAVAPLAPLAAASPLGQMAATSIGLGAHRFNHLISAIEKHPLYKPMTGGPFSMPKAKSASMLTKLIEFIEQGRQPAGPLGRIFNEIQKPVSRVMSDAPPIGSINLPRPVAAPPERFRI